MPRYSFHVFENGHQRTDAIDVELANDAQVREEAMRLLPAIAKDEVPRDGDVQAYTVLVTDEASASIYTATLNFAGLWLK